MSLLHALRPGVDVFVGRLARNQYLNLDQVVSRALAAHERLSDDLRLAA